MALFAMADLHLSLGIKDKPMDVFGVAWQNYMEKINEKCRSVLTDDDVLLVPGDISWATYMEQATEDFNFIEALPGKKIISKGNHDYWWDTISKLGKFKIEKDYKTIEFLHNNFFVYENVAVCGNRGWMYSASQEDIKIYDRELSRLELSLSAAHGAGFDKKIVMTHFPPTVALDAGDDRMIRMMNKYGVTECIYGHLHNVSPRENYTQTVCGIKLRLVAADYLEFNPVRIL